MSQNPIKLNQLVKVISATDDTANADYIGKQGVVINLNANGYTGNFEGDELIKVLFMDGTTELFWQEELEVVK